MTGPPCFVGGIAKSNLITVTIRSSKVPTVDIDASALKICSGTSVNFNAKLQDSDTTYRIQWKLNGADAGSNSNLFVTRNLKDGDKVGFVLTSIYGCFPPIPSDMLTISVEDLPVVRIFPSDTIVSYGATVNLRASVLDSVVSYSWTPVTSLSDPRVSNPITYPLVKSTTFTVTAVSAGKCANSATGIVRVEQKLIMPNAFTPNDDAKNDLFRIPPSVTMKLESFSIFNLWGERIFFTANRDEGWNGKVKGVLQNSGTYIYIVVGSDADGPIYLKGTFSLIR
jgi:gliding motility-associated-like protein